MKRATTCVLSTALLAGMFVVVPVVSVGAAPHAVRPSVERVPMPAAHPTAARTTAAAAGANATPDTASESVLTRDTDGADVVGIGFPDRAAAKGVSVTVRSRPFGS